MCFVLIHFTEKMVHCTETMEGICVFFPKTIVDFSLYSVFIDLRTICNLTFYPNIVNQYHFNKDMYIYL